MFCKFCGAALQEDSVFCSVCGKKLEYVPANDQQTKANYRTESQAQPQNVRHNKPNAYMPMKWFKFLIYFALFAGAALNIISGLTYLFFSPNRVGYGYFEGLRAADIVFGMGCLALSGMAVYTRFRLSGFCFDGPEWLILNYILSMALSLFYNICILAIIDPVELPDSVKIVYENSMILFIISGIIGCTVAVVLNWLYFKKREHLFVNGNLSVVNR